MRRRRSIARAVDLQGGALRRPPGFASIHFDLLRFILISDLDSFRFASTLVDRGRQGGGGAARCGVVPWSSSQAVVLLLCPFSLSLHHVLRVPGEFRRWQSPGRGGKFQAASAAMQGVEPTFGKSSAWGRDLLALSSEERILPIRIR